MLNPRNRKFSVKYRIEKWFYEDSVNCLRAIALTFCKLLVCGAMFGALLFLPAFFH